MAKFGCFTIWYLILNTYKLIETQETDNYLLIRTRFQTILQGHHDDKKSPSLSDETEKQLQTLLENHATAHEEEVELKEVRIKRKCVRNARYILYNILLPLIDKHKPHLEKKGYRKLGWQILLDDYNCTQGSVIRNHKTVHSSFGQLLEAFPDDI